MLYLHLIVWTLEDWDSPEWTFVISKKDFLTIEDQTAEIKSFMRDAHGYEDEDYEVLDYWCNKVDRLDDYKVMLVKEPKVMSQKNIDLAEEITSAVMGMLTNTPVYVDDGSGQGLVLHDEAQPVFDEILAILQGEE